MGLLNVCRDTLLQVLVLPKTLDKSFAASGIAALYFETWFV